MFPTATGTAAPTAPAPDPAPRPSPGRTLRGLLHRAGPALLGYVAVRLLGTCVLMKWAHLQRHGLWPLLANRWDSRWYTGIADHGYAASLDPSRFDACNLAFFPLYPVVVKAVAGVTPGSRATIGLLVAVGCSLLAAWGIYAVGERLHGRRVGTVLAVLWGATPVAAVQWMGYTESLFTALVAWSLYAVLTDRWVTAGALCLLAGLTRPTGVALVAAVCVSAVVALWRLRRTGPAPMPLDPDRNRIRRIVLGAVLAPLGWLAYVGWVGVRLGRADGYFAVQRQWRNEWDGGRETLRALRATLVHQSNPQLYLVVVSLVLIMSVVLFLLCLSGHRSLPLLVFSGVLLVVVLGSGGVYFPRARFLLPGFPLLLPLALALAGTRRRTAVLCLSVAALGSAYFGAYMLLTYRGAL
ncbi:MULTISPECIES: membrane protein [Streptomyces]|uniref:membrane protein n=1 Tax=Streptomyces TaxID=1883 RepID=UPI0004CD4B8D|nr:MULTISPECIES: membrane protein [Streptomyces]